MPARGDAPQLGHDPHTGEVLDDEKSGQEGDRGDVGGQDRWPDTGGGAEGEGEGGPREQLIDKLRDDIMAGATAMRVLSMLQPQEMALLTDQDRADLRAFHKGLTDPNKPRREPVDG